jgi:hypothetical protein
VTHDALAGLTPRARRQLPEDRAIRAVYRCTLKGRESVLVLATERVFLVANSGWSSNSAPLHLSWLRALGGTVCDLQLWGEHLKLEFSTADEAVRVALEVDALAEAERQGEQPYAPHLQAEERLVRECVFLGGANVSVDTKARVDLLFAMDELRVYRSPLVRLEGEPITRLQYGVKFNIELSGPGRFTTGGGFVGGGLGLMGAAEGMAIAGILNALTTRTHALSVIAVLSAEYEGFFLCQDLAPDELRRGLAPVFLRARQLSQASPPDQGPMPSAGPSDIVATLERLSTLHQAGALTDDEFQRAKAQALGI